MAWTTSDTRFESTSFKAALELSPTDYLMQDDSIPEEHIHLLAIPKPAWTIPSSNKSDVVNNWASALATPYEPPAENSLLAKIGDMTTFMNWYCQKVNKTVLAQADFEGQAYEVVKAFYPDVIHLQFQMEECHKMLTAQVDWTNLEVDHQGKQSCTIDFQDKVQNMASLTGGLIDRSSILTDMILHRVEKMSEHTCGFSVSDFEDLNLLLLQGHLDHLPGSDKRMLSTAVKQWTRNLVIRQRVEDFQLGIKSYQTHLNLTKPGWDATGYKFNHDYTIIESPRAVVFPVDNNNRKIMRFNEIYKFSDGTLIHILEALDYIVKEFKVKRLNPERIFWNLECFVGGRVRDIDYRLLQRTK
ncbi:hypothetical protein Tco_0452772 [Tanacetum coccineum]